MLIPVNVLNGVLIGVILLVWLLAIKNLLEL